TSSKFCKVFPSSHILICIADRSCLSSHIVFYSLGFPFIKCRDQRVKSLDASWKSAVCICVKKNFFALANSKSTVQCFIDSRLKLFQIAFSSEGCHQHDGFLFIRKCSCARLILRL